MVQYSVADLGQTNQVLKRYIGELHSLPNEPIADRTDRQGNGAVRVVNLWLENFDGQHVTDIPCSDKVAFKLSYRADRSYRSLRFIIGIYDDYEQRLLRFDSDINLIGVDHWPPTGNIICTLSSPISLCPGRYTVHTAVFADAVMADYLPYAFRFEIIEGDFFGTGKLHRHWPMFLLSNKWQLE